MGNAASSWRAAAGEKEKKKKSLSLPFQMDERFHEGAPVKED